MLNEYSETYKALCIAGNALCEAKKTCPDAGLIERIEKAISLIGSIVDETELTAEYEQRLEILRRAVA